MKICWLSFDFQVAERLYTQGFISYPRTETTHYPENFDLRSPLKAQQGNSIWGSYVRDLLSNGEKEEIHAPRNSARARSNFSFLLCLLSLFSCFYTCIYLLFFCCRLSSFFPFFYPSFFPLAFFFFLSSVFFIIVLFFAFSADAACSLSRIQSFS